MAANLEEALQALSAYDTEDALLALTAIEDQRKHKHFAKYWSCDDDPNHQIFFDGIEAEFKKFTKDVKIFGLLGGNRSSKTERGAFLAVAWLMGKEYFRDEPSWKYVEGLPIPEHGCQIWCVGLDFSVIRDVIWGEKLRKGHQHPGLLPSNPCKEITRISDSEFQVVVDVNGRVSTLTCKSADSGRSKMQSASIDLVWIDEECEESIFDELWQRTTDCAGKLVITLTPLNDTNSGVTSPWVYDLYKDFLKGGTDSVFIKLSALDNPFIPDEEKIKLKEKWAGHPEEGARLYGDFIQRAGLIYPQWDRTKHLIKRTTIPADWRRIASIDPAATGMTACAWMAISPRNDVYLYRVYYAKNKIVSDHAKDILARNGSDKIDLWLIDGVWAACRNSENHKTGAMLYKESGIPVRLATRQIEFARNVMAEYLSATINFSSRHPKLYVFEDLHEFIEEVEGYTWDTYSKGVLKGKTKDTPRKVDDHGINAVQFVLALKPKNRRGSGIGSTGPNNSY